VACQRLINDCARLVELGKPQFGWFDMSTLKEPYRIEGKKTMGLELAAQMEWRLPDVVFYPTGGGTGLIGMWKAWQELLALGWISGPLRVWSRFNPPAARRSCAHSRPEQTRRRPGRIPARIAAGIASPRRWRFPDAARAARQAAASRWRCRIRPSSPPAARGIAGWPAPQPRGRGDLRRVPAARRKRQATGDRAGGPVQLRQRLKYPMPAVTEHMDVRRPFATP